MASPRGSRLCRDISRPSRNIHAQVGIVLDALDKSPHKDNTIVVLLGDHGWHLGEKECFGKATLWEEGNARAADLGRTGRH